MEKRREILCFASKSFDLPALEIAAAASWIALVVSIESWSFEVLALLRRGGGDCADEGDPVSSFIREAREGKGTTASGFLSEAAATRRGEGRFESPRGMESANEGDRMRFRSKSGSSSEARIVIPGLISLSDSIRVPSSRRSDRMGAVHPKLFSIDAIKRGMFFERSMTFLGGTFFVLRDRTYTKGTGDTAGQSNITAGRLALCGIIAKQKVHRQGL
jgi:hypothetical protein